MVPAAIARAAEHRGRQSATSTTTESPRATHSRPASSFRWRMKGEGYRAAACGGRHALDSALAWRPLSLFRLPAAVRSDPDAVGGRPQPASVPPFGVDPDFDLQLLGVPRTYGVTHAVAAPVLPVEHAELGCPD